MAQCVLCGTKGLFLAVTSGLCDRCMPVVTEKATASMQTIIAAGRAAVRVKTLDSRAEHYDRMIVAFQPLLEWEAKGVRISPTDPETGAVKGHTFVEELRTRRLGMDDDIVEELQAEAKDAEQRSAAALTLKKRARPLEGTLERVRYFKQKMLDPRRLDAIEVRLARALAGQPCRFCGQPRANPDEPCPGCGAAA